MIAERPGAAGSGPERPGVPIAMPTCILWRDLGADDCISRNTNPHTMVGFMASFWGKTAARSGQELSEKHRNHFSSCHLQCQPAYYGAISVQMTASAEIPIRILWLDFGERFTNPSGCQTAYYGAISREHDYIGRNTNPNTMARFRHDQ